MSEHQQRYQEKILVAFEEARRQKFTPNWKESKPTRPSFLGVRAFKNIDLTTIRHYIDWSPFFIAWELKGKFPNILKDAKYGTEATKLFNDANMMLDDIIKNNLLTAHASIGFFPANSCGDDIELYTDDLRTTTLGIVHTLRQQSQIRQDTAFLAQADYIAPKDSGIKDYLGAFALTTGLGLDAMVSHFEADHDDYKSILAKAIADRLAEACAEYLHQLVRQELWGYAKDENLSNEQLIHVEYTGIRPAPGYPACPDHTEKDFLFKMLNATALTGIELTESYAMTPTAAVCGHYFSHPQSKYFSLGKIGKDQVLDYAKRKAMSIDTVERWLGPNLGY